MFYLLLSVALFATACGQQNTADTAPTAALSGQATEGNQTEEPDNETPEPTPIDETEEPDNETPEPSVEERYNVTVSYGLEADSAPEAPQEPPEGSRWYVLAATIANQDGDTIEISRDWITLIDSDGESYPLFADDPSMTPPLFGTFEPGESVLGLGRFAIPLEATPAFLEVCFDAECNDIIRSETS